MIITPSISVISSDRVESGIDLHLNSRWRQTAPERLALEGAIAYVPLVNSHDHLIGNWFPRAGDKRPYHNSHIWVEDMKNSFSFLERNHFWFNDGSFDLTTKAALTLAQLGCYKNLFSGCAVVQDHGPVQAPVYYDSMPIEVIRKYRQCHSITLENWWGGESAEEEMKLTKGEIPYIIHLGEGKDTITKAEFAELKARDLLRRNTMLIHGIAFTPEELSEVAKAKASVCWCPTSNFYLIGETLKIEEALKRGVNVTIGTDSTMSGGVNLIFEFILVREKFPSIPVSTLYKMATENAAYALMLPERYGKLIAEDTRNLMLMDALDSSPFENLLVCDASNIRLLLHEGVPIYGDTEWLEWFDLNEEDYSTFRTGNKEKFVVGDPQDLNDQIDLVLGYHKDFPYLPF
ncbi:MAG TPA: amidohydrolase family protein [Candidatus Cloacimonadota bacterium]|nr:amidohydrolase family protein [Candidatus Cloacimonadota bacterium]HPS40251.1 amidohydrolase family protein [Candidatus Cloacimonadota bacterium]